MDYAAGALPWSLSEIRFVDYLGRMTQLFTRLSLSLYMSV